MSEFFLSQDGLSDWAAAEVGGSLDSDAGLAGSRRKSVFFTSFKNFLYGSETSAGFCFTEAVSLSQTESFLSEESLRMEGSKHAQRAVGSQDSDICDT